MLDHLTMLSFTLEIAWHKVRRITIFERGDGACHVETTRWVVSETFHRNVSTQDRLTRDGDCLKSQFPRALTAAPFGKGSLVSPECVGGDDVRARVEVIQMNLFEGLRIVIVEQRVGRPQRQAGVHSAPMEFCAGCAVEEERVVHAIILPRLPKFRKLRKSCGDKQTKQRGD